MTDLQFQPRRTYVGIDWADSASVAIPVLAPQPEFRNFQQKTVQVDPTIAKWQDEGLMPESEDGFLLWKHVAHYSAWPRLNWQIFKALRLRESFSTEHDRFRIFPPRRGVWYGNLGLHHIVGRALEIHPQNIDSQFIEKIPPMACAGPWGCLTDYTEQELEPFLMAIWCTQPRPATVNWKYRTRDGVYFCFGGYLPVAVYQARNLTRSDFDPVLISSVGDQDPMALITGYPSAQDPNIEQRLEQQGETNEEERFMMRFRSYQAQQLSQAQQLFVSRPTPVPTPDPPSTLVERVLKLTRQKRKGFDPFGKT